MIKQKLKNKNNRWRRTDGTAGQAGDDVANQSVRVGGDGRYLPTQVQFLVVNCHVEIKGSSQWYMDTCWNPRYQWWVIYCEDNKVRHRITIEKFLKQQPIGTCVEV